ncbi:MAG TPA: alpha/beta hydrolase [Candidatus Nanopelagicaceae bacterium]|nr:alpha/beta hydrolase [Candidatus Nanopelagicaceae bacterium]
MRFKFGTRSTIALILAVGVALGFVLSVNSASKPTGSVSVAKIVDQPSLMKFATQKLVWNSCYQTFQCTKVTVPLDYSHPNARTITLAVTRHLATDQKHRLGSLLLNPGGPGGSGVDYVLAADYIATKQILARYDLVGFDPRGVGRSTPIHCLTDTETDRMIALDGTPTTPGQIKQLMDASKTMADLCQLRAGAMLPFIGSTNVARDLDLLRAVLGDAKLNYLGKSYGTLIGAIYADLFPKRVGHVVLDGAIDPTVPNNEMNLDQARGFQIALGDYITSCLKKHNCPGGNTRAAVLGRIGKLLADSDITPVPSKTGRVATQSLVLLGIVSTLYDSEGGWPSLTIALNQAYKGDSTALLYLSDYYVDRNENGHYTTNSNDIGYAVNCLDKDSRETVAQMQADAKKMAKVSPDFGAYLAWGLAPCDFWPTPPAPYPAPIAAKGAGPILVVGTTHDPATPYQWAQGLANQLQSGVLLTRDGEGHTGYMMGNNCIDQAVDRYFLTGKTPAKGTICR